MSVDMRWFVRRGIQESTKVACLRRKDVLLDKKTPLGRNRKAQWLYVLKVIVLHHCGYNICDGVERIRDKRQWWYARIA